jgi:hypothetical protein
MIRVVQILLVLVESHPFLLRGKQWRAYSYAPQRRVYCGERLSTNTSAASQKPTMTIGRCGSTADVSSLGSPPPPHQRDGGGDERAHRRKAQEA